jgi:DNA-binding NarL/FixJ family response regulator
MRDRTALILVAEDNPRDRTFIQEQLADRQLAFATSGDEAWGTLGQRGTDRLITDIQLPGLNGIELARRLWTLQPRARVLFWTQHGDEMYVRTLERESGGQRVYGLVLKDSPPEELRRAVSTVFDEGQCWIDPRLHPVRSRAGEQHRGITDAEFEVLVDVALGLTDRMIGERHLLTRRGVQNRLRSLYEKLGVDAEQFREDHIGDAFNPRARAVASAFCRGLLNAYELERANVRLQEWLVQRMENAGPQEGR